jgi:hypothetical protein
MLLSIHITVFLSISTAFIHDEGSQHHVNMCVIYHTVEKPYVIHHEQEKKRMKLENCLFFSSVRALSIYFSYTASNDV